MFFLACFFFADRFFNVRKLSVLFIIALVITRYYSIWEVGVGFFQVSPLRLDLWILPILAAYWKSAYHWLVGLSLGLLVMFHRTFGLIYLGSYVELAMVLFLVDSAPSITPKQFSASVLRTVCLKHIRLNAHNLIIATASIAFCFIVYGELVPSSALIYGKLGAFMIMISPFSFYLYF